MNCVWIPYGLCMDPVWIRYRSSTDPIRILYEFCIDSIWTPYRSSTDPTRILYGFRIDSVLFHYCFLFDPTWPSSDRPAFFRMDLRVQKIWPRKWVDWMLYLAVYNATNRANPFIATYNYDYSELIDIASLPIIPTLGIEAKY